MAFNDVYGFYQAYLADIAYSDAGFLESDVEYVHDNLLKLAATKIENHAITTTAAFKDFTRKVIKDFDKRIDSIKLGSVEHS